MVNGYINVVELTKLFNEIASTEDYITATGKNIPAYNEAMQLLNCSKLPISRTEYSDGINSANLFSIVSVAKIGNVIMVSDSTRTFTINFSDDGSWTVSNNA